MGVEYKILSMNPIDYQVYASIHPQYAKKAFVQKKLIYDFGLDLIKETTDPMSVYIFVSRSMHINPKETFDYGIVKGSCSLVRLLLEMNPDFSKEAALILAAQNYQMEVFEFLISRGAKIGPVTYELAKIVSESNHLGLFLSSLYHGLPLEILQVYTDKEGSFSEHMKKLKPFGCETLQDKIRESFIEIYTGKLFYRNADNPKNYISVSNFKPCRKEFLTACREGNYPIVDHYVKNLIHYSFFSKGLSLASLKGHYLIIDRLLETSVQFLKEDIATVVKNRRYDTFRLIITHFRLAKIQD